ncbi:MAG: SDR family NAD(P)-dependent oxidoreductase [Candidatus Promineifilaceae bacterium]|nr:SDR family NAD(P)-dependent oxidoreductase [Candidatus Promineifilaceae bacterium]
MRILVTGATGFIGSALVERLVAEGQAVVMALVRPDYREEVFSSRLQNILEQIALVIADVRDLETVVVALEKARPDLIFHLAAAGVRNPFLPIEEALAHNLHGTLNVLRAAFELRSAGGEPLGFITGRTPGEDAAMNHYAASKAAAWQICRMYARTQGWPISGATIFQAYGPGQRGQNLIPAAVKAAREGRDFPMTAGDQQRDWIYVDDVVEGLLAVARSGQAPGSQVDLGTGRLVSVADMVRRIYAAVGGKGQPLPGALPARPGEQQIQVADARRTKRLTGWEASVDLETGLRRLLES